MSKPKHPAIEALEKAPIDEDSRPMPPYVARSIEKHMAARITSEAAKAAKRPRRIPACWRFVSYETIKQRITERRRNANRRRLPLEVKAREWARRFMQRTGIPVVVKRYRRDERCLVAWGYFGGAFAPVEFFGHTWRVRRELSARTRAVSP